MIQLGVDFVPPALYPLFVQKVQPGLLDRFAWQFAKLDHRKHPVGFHVGNVDGVDTIRRDLALQHWQREVKPFGEHLPDIPGDRFVLVPVEGD